MLRPVGTDYACHLSSFGTLPSVGVCPERVKSAYKNSKIFTSMTTPALPPALRYKLCSGRFAYPDRYLCQ
ncbi:hypothetical protein AVEN_233810-1 [Araneus ventricosus]|uniref:Uncharacterized protein n=1 Tax=Araneus ventricosus TaxID=182803 RepID=A0A4Y2J3T3_ARAVE|nr:hypothetical protein AVEN_233810-1 [Araneus ventricosus]